MNKLQHWLLNSNLGTAIIIGLVGFSINATLEYLKLKDRVKDIEESHIIFHYYDLKGHCVVLEHNEEYYCVRVEEDI